MPFSTLTTALSLYTDTTNHIVPGPNNVSYFVPFLLLIAALCIDPSLLSHGQLCLLFLPAIYAFQIHSWSLMHGVDVISICLSLWTFVLLVCHDPRKNFRRMYRKRGDQPTKESDQTKLGYVTDPTQKLNHSQRIQHDSTYREEPYPSSFPRRLRWVLTLLPSLRLPSWLISFPSHDRTQPPIGMTRAAFFRMALSSILEGYLILDLTSLYTPYDPYFHHSGVAVDSPYPQPSISTPTIIITLWAARIPPRLLRTTVLAAQIYALIPRLFPHAGMVPLALDYFNLISDAWSPHTWPPFFGSFSYVLSRGLRGLWGQWWHQTNRHLTSDPGVWLADQLGLRPGGSARYALLVISGFGFSGVMHMGLIPPFPLHTSFSAMTMRLYVAGFFWAQIPGIFAELLVAKFVTNLGPGMSRWRVARVLTLTWVAAWLSITLPLLSIPFRELGYWSYHPMPVSVLRGLGGTGWLTWTREAGIQL